MSSLLVSPQSVLASVSVSAWPALDHPHVLRNSGQEFSGPFPGCCMLQLPWGRKNMEILCFHFVLLRFKISIWQPWEDWPGSRTACTGPWCVYFIQYRTFWRMFLFQATLTSECYSLPRGQGIYLSCMNSSLDPSCLFSQLLMQAAWTHGRPVWFLGLCSETDLFICYLFIYIHPFLFHLFIFLFIYLLLKWGFSM